MWGTYQRNADVERPKWEEGLFSVIFIFLKIRNEQANEKGKVWKKKHETGYP